jgi:hypothetical protein
MTQNTTQTQPVLQQPAPKKPNDTGSISVEGFVRIFDPETKEVFVEKRA